LLWVSIVLFATLGDTRAMESMVPSESERKPGELILPEKTSGKFDREILQELWPGEILVEKCIVPIEGELKRAIVQRCRVKTTDHLSTIFRIRDAKSQELGHVVILDEIGKYRPITFFVALDARDHVLDLQVLVYREHIGKEIESARFTRQFRDKRSSSILKLHRDIRNLSGATLSARAAVRAVRRALATVEEAVRADDGLLWQRHSGPVLTYGDLGGGEPFSASGMEPSPPAEQEIGKTSGSTVSFRNGEEKLIQRARPAMGTILKIDVFGDHALAAVDAAFAEVERIESLHSRWRRDSDVCKVEAASTGQAVKVSAETIEVVERALQMSRESGGAFDLTLKKTDTNRSRSMRTSKRLPC